MGWYGRRLHIKGEQHWLFSFYFLVVNVVDFSLNLCIM